MYYFAYGSNMDWQQIQRRCPSSKFVCVACLQNYRFAIGRHSRLRDCGTATIVAESGAAVWGTVYDINAADLGKLDTFEDGYRRETISVQPSDHAHPVVEAWVYIAEMESSVPLPNPAYKRHLLEGARHWNLPESYRAMLKNIDVGSP